MAVKYTKEFKQEALGLCEQEGMTVARVGRDLGIPDGVLYRWRQEARRDGADAFRGKGHADVAIGVSTGTINYTKGPRQ